MKKIIAAAVAASMSAVAMADISITGNANYEYFAKTEGGAVEKTTNDADMEVNLSVVGKTGDTSVVANFEISGASVATYNTYSNRDSDGESSAIDVEDLYITTKVGDVSIKAGDYASGTTALGGEIDNGSRSFNKVTLSTQVGPATVSYATASASAEDATFDNDGSSVSVSVPVAGMTLQVKDESDSYTIVGLKGESNGVNFRIENKDSDTANSDVLFYEIGTKLGDLDVSIAGLDADAHSLIKEDDSAIFAQEATGAYVDGVQQITIGTSIDGTALKLRAGSLKGIATKQDADFMRVEASRTLASGATLTVSYDDYEDAGVATSSTKYDTQLLEIDLAVKF
jgi:hypothetical protein